MNKKDKPKSIVFRIENIKVTNFYIDNSFIHWELPNGHEYTFEVNSDVKYNKKEKKMVTTVNANIFLEKEKKNNVCSITVLVIYALPEYDSLIKQTNGKVNAPPEIIKLFLSTHIAMVRGMLYEKTQGTFLQNVYLPPINVNDFVKEEKNELKQQGLHENNQNAHHTLSEK